MLRSIDSDYFIVQKVCVMHVTLGPSTCRTFQHFGIGMQVLSAQLSTETDENPYMTCLDEQSSRLSMLSSSLMYRRQKSVDLEQESSRSSYFYRQIQRRRKRARDADEAKCRQLFDVLDNSGIGMIHRSALINLLEDSLDSCHLQVQGMDVGTLVDLFMNDCLAVAPNKDTKRKYIAYDDFRIIYRKYIAKNAKAITARDRRSSIASLVTAPVVEKGSKLNEPDQREDLPTSVRFEQWLSNHKLQIIWISIYIVLNVVSFGWKFYQYAYLEPAAFALSGYGLAFARGFAQVCLLNTMLILLPLARGVTQQMRNVKWFRENIPFDSSIGFHAICGYNLIFSGVAHAAAQLYSYMTKVMVASDEIWYASSLAKSNAFPGPRPTLMDLLRTVPGWTGAILILCTIIATPFTLKVFRRRNFNLFWYTHYFYYPVFLGALWPHGIQSWLEPTQAWAWMTLPIILYILDRRHRYRMYGKTGTFKVVSADITAGTLWMKIEKPKHFRDYLPGMYIFINVPSLSKYEWHPFTLTSSPADDFLSVHVRDAGDWTNALHYLFKQHIIGLKSGYPEIRVDGPVGAPAQEYLHYDTVMMIGGGIGVTPFASILRDLAIRLKDGQCKNCGTVNYHKENHIKKLYFHWATRDQNAFSWFSHCLNQVTKLDEEGRIEVHTHLTNLNKDPRAAVLKMMQTFVHNRTGHDVLSGLKTKTRTHFGRADWNGIFKTLVEKHPNETVGVFFCGPRAFQLSIQDMCNRHSINNNNVTFDFHSETF